jgi:hypothetical protein
MQFNLEKSIELLERTPTVIEALLEGLSDEWLHCDEGENTWSPYVVTAHLIHTEKTNWIPRMEVILSSEEDKSFPPFDRFGQLTNSNGESLTQLISEFKTIRKRSIEILKSKKLTPADLHKTGIHPQLGQVTLGQLLASWTVHDMTHISQIIRVMAKQYTDEVGPWRQNLSILK